MTQKIYYLNTNTLISTTNERFNPHNIEVYDYIERAEKCLINGEKFCDAVGGDVLIFNSKKAMEDKMREILLSKEFFSFNYWGDEYFMKNYGGDAIFFILWHIVDVEMFNEKGTYEKITLDDFINNLVLVG